MVCDRHPRWVSGAGCYWSGAGLFLFVGRSKRQASGGGAHSGRGASYGLELRHAPGTAAVDHLPRWQRSPRSDAACLSAWAGPSQRFFFLLTSTGRPKQCGNPRTDQRPKAKTRVPIAICSGAPAVDCLSRRRGKISIGHQPSRSREGALTRAGTILSPALGCDLSWFPACGMEGLSVLQVRPSAAGAAKPRPPRPSLTGTS